VSARISGVKNFVSQNISLVRGLPFSHVQSASENGATLATSAWAGALAGGVAATAGAAEEELAVGASAFAGTIGVVDTLAFAVVTGAAGCSGSFDFFSSASNSSMRFLIASSSLAMAGGIC
jgi:hypothetical protein